jgi:hypothetical protein
MRRARAWDRWLAGVGAAFAAVCLVATPARAADGGTTTCRRIPAGQRVVRLNLKPETDVADLVAWISTITCKTFVVPGPIATGKKVTIYAPGLITGAEAYRLFLAALDSVGLAVYRADNFWRVIEAPKARTSAIPIYGFDEPPLPVTN